MKVIVIGGSGLIGKKLTPLLRLQGHEVVPASPSSGVNALTGEGLAEALKGADVVVGVSNSPSFADDAVMAFFDTSTRNSSAGIWPRPVNKRTVVSDPKALYSGAALDAEGLNPRLGPTRFVDWARGNLKN